MNRIDKKTATAANISAIKKLSNQLLAETAAIIKEIEAMTKSFKALTEKQGTDSKPFDINTATPSEIANEFANQLDGIYASIDTLGRTMGRYVDKGGKTDSETYLTCKEYYEKLTKEAKFSSMLWEGIDHKSPIKSDCEIMKAELKEMYGLTAEYDSKLNTTIDEINKLK